MSQSQSSFRRPIGSYRADSPDVFWLVLFFLAALNWFDSSFNPLAVSTEVYSVPISPLFIVLAVLTLVVGVRGIISSLFRVFIWEGKLEVRSRFASQAINLNGAKLRYGPYGLFRAGLSLEDAGGKQIALPLPPRTDLRPHTNLVFLSALKEWGVDIGSGAARQFAGLPSDAQGFSFDRAAQWKLKVIVLSGVALMFVPEGYWVAFDGRGALPVWLNWLILLAGFSVSTAVLTAIPDPLRPFAKSGLVLDSGEVTLLREGEALWRAPIRGIRVEVTRPPGVLMRQALFKAWSGDAPLRLPGSLDHWGFDAEDVAVSLMKMGVPVEILDEVWVANS